MKEYPIIFSTDMVQAILEGRKTQTRRLVKRTAFNWLNDFTPDFVAMKDNSLSPYGYEGDTLWVRESFRKLAPSCTPPDCRYEYKASFPQDDIHKWKPSIHMPRDAARMLLEVTGLRIERLNDISKEDAEKEGVDFDIWDQAIVARKYGTKDEWFQVWSEDLLNYSGYDTIAIDSFKSLWESIHGKESWQLNPWVWVISFKKKQNEIPTTI